MNIRRSCISAEWECSTDTSTLSAPGYEAFEDVHMNGTVLNLKESGLYSNQVKKGQIYKRVQTNECFDVGKQEQEKSELTQLVLQLITRIFKQGNAG